jgi:hypothetical protein
MSDIVERGEAASIIHISVPDEQLGKLLLEGKFIAYHDNKYGVTSGEHYIVMKLVTQEDQFVLFYLHVPYAYPIPEGVKNTVKTSLETILNRTIQKMEYINSGTESEKKNIQFRVELGGKAE